jgi:signal transduction histidine kinase
MILTIGGLAVLNAESPILQLCPATHQPHQNADLQFNSAYDPELLQVVLWTHSSYLRKLFLCLLDNAFKFTSEGEVKLEIRATSHTNSQITLSFVITDSGIGIADEHLQLLQTRFEQGTLLNNKPQGIGLGLALSSHLMRLLGGEPLKLESAYPDSETYPGLRVSGSLTFDLARDAHNRPALQGLSGCFITLDRPTVELTRYALPHISWHPTIGSASSFTLGYDYYIILYYRCGHHTI